jgi:hypothetical protein
MGSIYQFDELRTNKLPFPPFRGSKITGVEAFGPRPTKKGKTMDNTEYRNMLFEQLIMRIDEIKYSDEKKGKTRTEREYLQAVMKSIVEEWGEKDKEDKVTDMFKSKSLLNSSD